MVADGCCGVLVSGFGGFHTSPGDWWRDSFNILILGS
jgi:hypothetical protein